MPKAWTDLTLALQILSKHPTDETSPTWCEHDTLHVNADESRFTPSELTQLERLGFEVDNQGGFYSFLYGSA